MQIKIQANINNTEIESSKLDCNKNYGNNSS